jgi:putative transposase
MSEFLAVRDVASGVTTTPCPRNEGPLLTRSRARAVVSESERATLSRWLRAGTTPQRVARRCRIVLVVADGHSDRRVAAITGVTIRTVRRWQQRFAAGGPEALLRDAPGRGRPRTVPATARALLFALLERVTQADGSRWTVRALARESGLARSTVQRFLEDRRRRESAIPGQPRRGRRIKRR